MLQLLENSDYWIDYFHGWDHGYQAGLASEFSNDRPYVECTDEVDHLLTDLSTCEDKDGRVWGLGEVKLGSEGQSWEK